MEQSGCVVELGFGVQSEEKLCPSLSLDPNVMVRIRPKATATTEFTHLLQYLSMDF